MTGRPGDARAPRRIRIIADDYGLSPGVSRGIAGLLAAGRLSGTGCMTVFDGFEQQAAQLARAAPPAAIGLHLVLTDHPPLTGGTGLPAGTAMPTSTGLIVGLATGRISRAGIARELDAQLARFEAAFGHPPAFIDGHHHVHLLPAVRGWLAQAAPRLAPGGWVRGTPGLRFGNAVRALPQVLLGLGFARHCRDAGLAVAGPLAGYYGFHAPCAFAGAAERAIASLPDGGILMVHPGHPDDVLRARDRLVEARLAELDWLGGDGLPRAAAASGASVAAPDLAVPPPAR